MGFVIFFLILGVAVTILIFVLYNNSIIKECNQKYNDRFNQIRVETLQYVSNWCNKNDNISEYNSMISYVHRRIADISNIKKNLQDQRYTISRLKKVTDNYYGTQEMLGEIYNNIFTSIKNETYDYLQNWCKSENTYNSLDTFLHSRLGYLQSIKRDLQKDQLTASFTQRITERISEIQEISGMKNTIAEYARKLSSLPQSKMIDVSEYGKCNRVFYNSVKGLTDNEVVRGIDEIVSIRSAGNYINSFRIDYIKAIQYMWYYAMKKPFNVSNYNSAVKSYRMVFGEYISSDLLLSGLYYIKQLGSDNIIEDKIRNLLKTNRNSNELSVLASGLMWMGAFKAEKMVLEGMVMAQCSLTPKQQTRLHALANSSGNAPNSHDVATNKEEMYIDISSLSWDDDAYNAFFENLAFQDKALTYSLAVRDDTKDLMIKNPSSVPSEKDILASIKETLTNEFGNAAIAESKDTVAISGSSQERMKGVFVTSRQCNYLGILVYLVPIGRKLNIKFYSLLVPVTNNNKEVQQQALSLKNNISPSATMWESSLKDSILLAIQHLLNRGSYNTNPISASAPTENGGEVLF